MRTGKRIFLWIIALLVVITTIMGSALTTYAAGFEDVAVSSSIYLDEDGNFVFISYDKKKTSSTSYKTIGFTISRCIQVEKEEYIPEEYVTIPLSTRYTPVEIVSETQSHICNKWTIKADYVMQLIAEKYPDWYTVLNSEDGYYLKFDAIMVIVKNGIDGGHLSADGTPIGTVYDKHNKEELKQAENWADPNRIDTHFDKYFFVGEVLDEDSQLGTDAPAEEFQETIGKNTPFYRTWNINPEGIFDLSQGIPTSENIMNGFEADGWFGTVDIGKHQTTKTYAFNFKINYDSYYYPGDTDGDGIDDPPRVTTATENYTYTVTRAASYFYIQNMALYDFKDGYIKNSVYPGDTIVYDSTDHEIPFDITVNGIQNPDIVETWIPDDNVHVDWPVAQDISKEINAGSLEEGKTIAADAAERAVGNATVHNDRIVINDKIYMTDEPAPGDRPHMYAPIAEDDYAIEQYEETVKIPSNVANGIYATENKVRYLRVAPKTLAAKIFEELHIKEGFEPNEPIYVHTPVISPVTIIDPETGRRYPGEDTQLISENRLNVDYELLLDGTYTFRFDPETHRDIQGYGWSGDPSKYDKYTAFKEAMFPFDVEVNGKFYEKDTWVTLPDFRQNTFYITPWTEEKDEYIIKYRVAPENVVDENGVNHIDDTEYLHNLDMSKYVATYEIKVEVSGRMYGFEVDGINDRDTFGDPQITSGTDRISLASMGHEKKTGVKNRIGGNRVRQTATGNVISWETRDTLPFSNGRSNFYDDMGTLYAGTDFSFTFYTMANLQDSRDEIIIRPTFRYIDKNGNEIPREDIEIYYSSDAGYFIKAGSDKELADLMSVTISDEEFKDTYSDADVMLTVNHDNDLQGMNITAKQYIEQKIECSSLSKICLTNSLRLLMGSYEHLERNLDRSLEDEMLPIGKDEELDEAHYKMLQSSIQKWYGTYRIPSKLYVHIREEGDDPDNAALEYAKEHGGISENSAFWEKNGYLVLNFEIASKNEGEDHLQYFPSTLPENEERLSEGKLDQWYVENFGRKNPDQQRNVFAGSEKMMIPVESGDVAVICIGDNFNDRFHPGIMIIN